MYTLICRVLEPLAVNPNIDDSAAFMGLTAGKLLRQAGQFDLGEGNEIG